MAMTDQSLMPFGMHKGKQLQDVPADYLLWLYDQGNLTGQLLEYIEDNLDVLRMQSKKK